MSKIPNPKIIISTAPIKNSSPVVENKPVADFIATSLSDLLTKKVAMIAKIHATTITSSNAARSGNTAEGSMLLVSGVKP